MKRIPSRRTITLIAAGIVSLIVFLIVGIDGPKQRKAKRRAAELNLRTIDASFLDYTGSSMLIRAESPESSVLLFRRVEEGYAVSVDVTTGSVSRIGLTTWHNATGEVTDDVQIFRRPRNWEFVGKKAQLHHSGNQAATTGRHVVNVVSSPGGERIALITADGSFRPGTTGMIFGGSWAHATGQHYVEVLNTTGRPVMEAVALPFKTSSRGNIQLNWTADHRYLICNFRDKKCCIIPTGLNANGDVLSGADTQEPGISLFQLDRWWNEFFRPDMSLQVRYEHAASGVLLLNDSRAKSTYRYDPVVRTLTPVSQRTWQHAETRISKGTQLEAVRTNWHRDSLDRELRDALFDPGECGSVSHFTFSPHHRAVAVAFCDETIVGHKGCLQVFSLPDYVPLGTPLEGAGRFTPYWSPDGRYVFTGDWIVGTGLTPLTSDPHGIADTNAQLKRTSFPLKGMFHWGQDRFGAYIAPTLQGRWAESGKPDILLYNLRRREVLRYVAADNRITSASEADWTNAAGSVWQPYEMVGAGQVLQNDRYEGRLHRVGETVPDVDGKVLAIEVGPALTRAVIISKVDDESAKPQFRIARLPEGNWIGEAQQFPPGISLRSWAWAPDDRYVMFANYDKRSLYIVHTSHEDTALDR